MADLQSVRKALDEIERTLTDCSYGWRNEGALRSIQNQVRIIRREVGSMVYIDEKLGSLIDWADKLYSPRKWMRSGSAEQVRHFALLECGKIGIYLPQLSNDKDCAPERASEH